MTTQKTTQSFQDLMKEIYFHRDKVRGVDSTFLWLLEEVGELSKAIRKMDTQNIREEFGDVFAWLCSLANLLDINILEVAYEKYPEICPKCSKKVCECKT